MNRRNVAFLIVLIAILAGAQMLMTWTPESTAAVAYNVNKVYITDFHVSLEVTMVDGQPHYKPSVTYSGQSLTDDNTYMGGVSKTRTWAQIPATPKAQIIGLLELAQGDLNSEINEAGNTLLPIDE